MVINGANKGRVSVTLPGSFVSAGSFAGRRVLTVRSLNLTVGGTVGISNCCPRLLHGGDLNVVFRRISAHAHLSFRATVASLNNRTRFCNPNAVRLNNRRSLNSATHIVNSLLSVVVTHISHRGSIINLTRNSTIPIVGNVSRFGRPARRVNSLVAVLRGLPRNGGVRSYALTFVNSTARIYISLVFVTSGINVGFIRFKPGNRRVPSNNLRINAIRRHTRFNGRVVTVTRRGYGISNNSVIVSSSVRYVGNTSFVCASI